MYQFLIIIKCTKSQKMEKNKIIKNPKFAEKITNLAPIFRKCRNKPLLKVFRIMCNWSLMLEIRSLGSPNSVLLSNQERTQPTIHIWTRGVEINESDVTLISNWPFPTGFTIPTLSIQNLANFYVFQELCSSQNPYFLKNMDQTFLTRNLRRLCIPL